MRDYATMRWVMAIVSDATEPLDIGAFFGAGTVEEVCIEIGRLAEDGLLESTVDYTGGIVRGGTVSGLTEEGRAFFKLVENDKVWALVLETLKKAGIDVSYPLLKEVCEEIVKRYVTSCIPAIGGR